MADRCIDRGGLEDEVAEFEIHLAVVLRETDDGGDGRGRAGCSTYVHEVVGRVREVYCVGAERQQRAEKVEIASCIGMKWRKMKALAVVPPTGRRVGKSARKQRKGKCRK